jgi:hypothetical protein
MKTIGRSLSPLASKQQLRRPIYATALVPAASPITFLRQPTFNSMKQIPITTENALLIRTDFSDQTAWKSLMEAACEPGDPFMFNMEVMEDKEYSGAALEQLMGALPEDYPHSFIVVADGVAVSESDHPLLVVDLQEERGRQFRAVAAQVASIDNNLSIANMGFEEFADMVDETGVFRGLPEM